MNLHLYLYLFGFEVRYACICGGAAYDIRDDLDDKHNHQCSRCPLCQPKYAYHVPERYHQRWK